LVFSAGFGHIPNSSQSATLDPETVLVAPALNSLYQTQAKLLLKKTQVKLFMIFSTNSKETLGKHTTEGEIS